MFPDEAMNVIIVVADTHLPPYYNELIGSNKIIRLTVDVLRLPCSFFVLISGLTLCLYV